MTAESNATVALEARITKAKRMVSALCQGEERWVMRIPAQPDSDPDLVIADGLQAGLEALQLAKSAALSAPASKDPGCVISFQSSGQQRYYTGGVFRDGQCIVQPGEITREEYEALSAPATTRAISDAWEILEAHVDNRRDMGHFGMATQMQEALDVLRSALESATATTGEVAVKVFLLGAKGALEGGDIALALKRIADARAALAALPPSSGWEAGAEAMREAAADDAGIACAVEHVSVRAAQAIQDAIRALPLPPPPSSGER